MHQLTGVTKLKSCFLNPCFLTHSTLHSLSLYAQSFCITNCISLSLHLLYLILRSPSLSFILSVSLALKGKPTLSLSSSLSLSLSFPVPIFCLSFYVVLAFFLTFCQFFPLLQIFVTDWKASNEYRKTNQLVVPTLTFFFQKMIFEVNFIFQSKEMKFFILELTQKNLIFFFTSNF